MIELDAGIVAKLESYRGVLAYMAVMLRGQGSWPTAHLAAAVSCQTAVMREGLEELSRLHPEAVRRKATKWVVGSGQASDEGVQILESEASRRQDLLDLIKKYWDARNPDLRFEMNGADGKAVGKFLKDHPEWGPDIWLKALRNRFKSDVVHSMAIHRWIAKLGDFIETPIDRYSKPMVNGGGKVGQAVTVEQANREARAAAVAGVPAGR